MCDQPVETEDPQAKQQADAPSKEQVEKQERDTREQNAQKAGVNSDNRAERPEVGVDKSGVQRGADGRVENTVQVPNKDRKDKMQDQVGKVHDATRMKMTEEQRKERTDQTAGLAEGRSDGRTTRYEPETNQPVGRVDEISAARNYRVTAFDIGSSSVDKPGFKEGVNRVAAAIKGYGEDQPPNVVVTGYESTSGHEGSNTHLGLDRANAIKQALIDQGIKEGSIKTLSFGNSLSPPADSSSAEKANWRAAEIEITPVTAGETKEPFLTGLGPLLDAHPDEKPFAHSDDKLVVEPYAIRSAMGYQYHQDRNYPGQLGYTVAGITGVPAKA